jgi:hypothetical protein
VPTISSAAKFTKVASYTGRVQLAAELPLLYTAGRPTPPEVNYPAPAEELADLPRRIRQSPLRAEPFLQSIPAHRYLPPSG